MRECAKKLPLQGWVDRNSVARGELPQANSPRCEADFGSAEGAGSAGEVIGRRAQVDGRFAKAGRRADSPASPDQVRTGDSVALRIAAAPKFAKLRGMPRQLAAEILRTTQLIAEAERLHRRTLRIISELNATIAKSGSRNGSTRREHKTGAQDGSTRREHKFAQSSSLRACGRGWTG
jgi:hypothetical protein